MNSMMKMMRVWMVALLLGGGAVGAETLDGLQQQACNNRALIKRYQADLDMAGETVRESRGEFLPALDFSYTLNRLNHDTALGENSENDTFTLTGSWNLFAGFKHHYDLKAALGQVRVRQFQMAAVEQDVCLNVALRFLSVYQTLENLRVTDRQVALYRDRLREIDLKVQVGVLRKADRLKVQVALDNALQEKRRAHAAVAAAMNDLAFETGITLDRDALDFSIFDLLPESMSMQVCREILLENRSDLNALRAAVDAAGMAVAASRASRYPRVDFSVSYSGHTRDDFFMESFETTHDEVRCRAVVSMNLFDGMKKYAGTRQAVLEKEKIRLDLVELEEGLQATLKNTQLHLGVAEDNLAVAKTGIDAAEENLRVTDLAFNQGIGTSSDVLDAIFNLSRAQFNLVSARTDLFDNHFRLKRLLETF